MKLSAELPRRDIDLDVVRGIAIFLAMGWHINWPTHTWFDVLTFPGRSFGWAGVDLFFVLSGFLVGRLILREYKADRKFNYRLFFIRRAFKLWPVLYTFLIFMCLAAPHQIGEFVWRIGLHIQNYFRTPVATHLWSLAVEEHFYILVALLFFLFSRRPIHPNILIFALLTIIIASPIARAIGWAFGAAPVDIQLQTHYRLDGLSCGVLFATMAIYKPELWNAALRPKWVYVLTFGAGYAFLTYVPKDTWLGATLGFTISYVSGAAVFMAIYKSGIEKFAYWPARLVAFLGVYSYAMYLWHVPIIKIVELLTAKLHLSVVLQISLSYTCSIFVAFVMTKIVERPFLNLREKLFPPQAILPHPAKDA